MRRARFALYVCLLGILSGCAATPMVRISNVEREKIARTLWEEGSSRTEGGIFGPVNIKVWPSYEAINKTKAVVKYEVSNFLVTTYGKDTIGILNEDSNSIIVSLKCEEKDEILFYFGGLFTLYHRNPQREREVMLGTVRRLEEEKNVSAEWLNKFARK